MVPTEKKRTEKGWEKEKGKGGEEEKEKCCLITFLCLHFAYLCSYRLEKKTERRRRLMD